MSPTFQAKQFSCKLDNLSITKKELYFLFLNTRLFNKILSSPLQLSCRLKKRIVTKEKINDQDKENGADFGVTSYTVVGQNLRR